MGEWYKRKFEIYEAPPELNAYVFGDWNLVNDGGNDYVHINIGVEINGERYICKSYHRKVWGSVNIDPEYIVSSYGKMARKIFDRYNYTNYDRFQTKVELLKSKLL